MKKLYLIVLMLSLTIMFSYTSSAQQQTVDFELLDIMKTMDPSSILQHCSGDFYYCDLADGTIKLTLYVGNKAELHVPAELDGKKVSVIGTHFLEHDRSVKKLVIPGSIHRIEEASIYGGVLETVEIQEGLSEVSGGAFTDCRLKTVNIPDSAVLTKALNEEINPFIGCNWLTEILVSKEHPTLTTINDVLFDKQCQVLISYPSGLTEKRYVIPDGVRVISAYAFNEQNYLTDIVIPYGVKTIDFCAFAWMDHLREISMPDSIISIGWGAFDECWELETVKLSNNIEQIGRAAFDATDIKTMILPDSIWYLGDHVFGDDCILFVKPDSYAEQYAIANSYNYEIPE